MSTRKQLRENEAQFRTLAESIPNLVWMADETGHIFWYNRRWYEYTGTTFEEMEGWGWKTVHDPAVLPAVLEQWEAAIQRGAPFEMIFPLRGSDGRFRRFLTRGQPIRDGDRLVRWFGTNTDIDNQERLREKAEASEDKLRSFFEAATQGILGVAADGRIALVNRRTEELFGYSRAELLGQPLEMLIPERFRSGHLAHRNAYFQEPRMRPMGAGLELAGRRKDGTEFPLEIGLSHVNTPDGPLAFGLITDISERVKVARELERVNHELLKSSAGLCASEEKFRLCLEAASQGILAVNREGRITLVNHRTEQMFGYSREELLGQPLSMLHPERLAPHFQSRLEQAFSDPGFLAGGSELPTQELAYRRKDGSEFPFTIGISRVNLPEGEILFGMINDITESKKAADDLKRVNDDLRRSNIEVEQFAHVASHDLQEPLRMVTGYLQLIERRYADRLDASGKEFIGFAVDGARRMKALIRDLLALSRAGTNAVHFRKIETASILDDALKNLKTAIDESRAVITTDSLPTIVGDPILLAQVFQNLIGNAIKFQKGSQPCIHVSAECQGAHWVFSVRDNGIGIESRHLERIFRIFERLHSVGDYSGSGIGLSITRKIVERHQGRIWVESQPGAGSTFYFSLPAGMGMAEDAPQLGRSATK